MLWSILLVVFVCILKLIYDAAKFHRRLPPGPRGLPFVGNFLQLGRLPHLTLTKWARKYGPIFSIRLGVRPCIVVNDVNTAREIFVKRGSNYSSRNQSLLINDVCYRTGKGISVLPYGAQWRKMRKAIHRVFNPNVVQNYLGVLDSQVKVLLKDLVEASNASNGHGIHPESILKKYSFNSVVALLIGRGFRESEGYIIQEFIKVTDELHQLNNVGASFLSYFSLLNKFQNNPVFNKGYEIRHKREQLICEIIQIGRLNRSESETVLETVQKHAKYDGLDEMDIIYLCDGLLRGGFDNSACFLTWAALVLARIPRIQNKLQAEIDQAVGPDRRPNYQTDSENMPYLEAFLKELFRFRAPSFLGIPHLSIDDDVLDQYFIPKKSLVILNSHAIHFDPKTFVRPEIFEPERFLDHGLTEVTSVWSHYSFGAGRRICPGSHFADRELWLAVAGIVWAFNIEERQTIPKRDLFRDEDMTRGLANYPLEYKVNFIPRHNHSL